MAKWTTQSPHKKNWDSYRIFPSKPAKKEYHRKSNAIELMPNNKKIAENYRHEVPWLWWWCDVLFVYYKLKTTFNKTPVDCRPEQFSMIFYPWQTFTLIVSTVKFARTCNLSGVPFLLCLFIYHWFMSVLSIYCCEKPATW